MVEEILLMEVQSQLEKYISVMNSGLLPEDSPLSLEPSVK